MADNAPEYRFPIRLAAGHRVHLALRGMTPEHSVLTLTAERVTVRAGTWSIDLPLDEVRSASIVEPGDAAIGVHHHRHGRWSIAGDTGRPLLRLELDRTVVARVPTVAILDVALEDPDRCLERLREFRPAEPS